jgi:Tfp pilus assembly protein PilN
MQQINLYKNLPQPIRSILDARALLLLYSVFCLMLIVSFFLGLIQKHHDTVLRDKSMQQYVDAQHRLVVLAAKYPTTVVQMEPPDVARLGQCKVKFSQYLTAFADGIIPGVWLTNISITDHGKTLLLKGHAQVENQVQAYVESLKQQPLLQNAALFLQDVTRANVTDKKGTTSVLSFSIASQPVNTHG